VGSEGGRRWDAGHSGAIRTVHLFPRGDRRREEDECRGIEKPARLSSDDLRRAGDLVRQAILRLAVLYWRGEHEREHALRRVENCAYEPATLDTLQRESDLERFLTEQGLLPDGSGVIYSPRDVNNFSNRPR